jgi:hypothetical protein
MREILLIFIYTIYMYKGGKTYIMHSSNRHVLSFMYYPAIYTLLNLLPLVYNTVEIIFKLSNNNYDNIVEGDTLIWVGVYPPDYSKLKKKNIYIIHFNLEPEVEDFNCDEIWTYSLYMFNEYKNSNLVKNKIIKYIPIIHDETLPITKYTENNSQMQLAFFGRLYFRAETYEILKATGLTVYEIYTLWSETDFNKFINNNTHIYLNLSKSNTKALASLRINKLLSHKCIIISEHTNEIDEELYKDIVFFKDLSEICSFYKSLIALSKSELETIANNSYQKFISIFNVKDATSLIQTYKIPSSVNV